MLNENFIEIAEEAPDTVITMLNGRRYIVKEKIGEIMELSAAYRRKIGLEQEYASERSEDIFD
jgi:flagellar protein FlbD